MIIFSVLGFIALAIITLFSRLTELYRFNRYFRQSSDYMHGLHEDLEQLATTQKTNQEAILEKFEAMENLARKREEKAERFYKEIIVIHDSIKSQQEELSAKVSAINGHEQMIIKEVQELKSDDQLVTKLRRKKK